MFDRTMNHMVSMAGPMMCVGPDDPRGRVPGFPQNMEGGMAMATPEDDPGRLARREARGMRRDWSHIKGLDRASGGEYGGWRVRVVGSWLRETGLLGLEILSPGISKAAVRA